MKKILFTGYAGDAGGILMYEKNREALENRFSRAFLSGLQVFSKAAREREDRFDELVRLVFGENNELFREEKGSNFGESGELIREENGSNFRESGELIREENGSNFGESGRPFGEEKAGILQELDSVSGKPKADGITLLKIQKGGLYKALWDFSEALKRGFLVDMKTVPIHQEIIEVSDLLGVNPYEISSNGDYLLAADEVVEERLREAGWPVFEIGQVSEEMAKQLLRNGETHYLNRPVKKPLY